ncbi:MAG TPA: tetratricopeptide repeat protein [Candidatus Limnocylindrales bacterium]|nr:tetratricopeptide repeat protein [Candidatus Limnocylindrales bacterium]
MLRRFMLLGALAVLAFAPVRLSAASKEIQELQRDVALLQEQLKQMQQAQEKNFTALTVLVQQSLDAANRANTAVAVIQSGFQQNIQQQQDKVVAPVVGLSTRMNGLSEDVRTVTQAVSDLAGQMSKIQSQLTDLSNAVKVMATPPPPPVQTGTTPDNGGLAAPGYSAPGGQTAPVGSPGGMTASVPPISSQQLYQNAERDRTSGNYDLALQEFRDYLKYYPTTELAANAQFYIAVIHFGQNDYQRALGEFDMVLERYPDSNSKREEAQFYKGLCLVKLGQRNQASDEFRDLISHYPRTERATQACNQLLAMGLHCPTSAAPARSNTKKKRGE